MGETLVYGTAFMEVSVQLVPQIDRMGSARAWLCLQRAGVGELANDPTAPFKCWLWIATVARCAASRGAGQSPAERWSAANRGAEGRCQSPPAGESPREVSTILVSSSVATMLFSLRRLCSHTTVLLSLRSMAGYAFGLLPRSYGDAYGHAVETTKRHH